MKIGVDIRCLMEKERTGIGEYAYQFLDDLFRKNNEQNLGNEYFLFWNSFHDVRKNLPRWDYPFVHYCGSSWPNKLLNLCLRFLKFPKLDKLALPRKSAIALFLGTSEINYFIFPNQNFYALSRGVKKTVVVHDLSPEIYPECFSPKQRLWHKMVNLRKMVQDADRIIAVSENTKLDIMNLYKTSTVKIVVLYPKISLLRYTGVSKHEDWIKPQTHEAFTYSHELGDSDIADTQQKYILFLGTIEPRKNVLGLLKAYEDIERNAVTHTRDGVTRNEKMLELWIAGKAGYKSKEVFEFWKNMKARDKVKFLGYVNEKKKWELLRGARMFIYPPFYEGFGVPVFEAMSVGVPVIASSTSSMHEIIGDAGILVDPSRVDDIAQAIKSLVDNGCLSETLSRAAIKRVTSFQSKTALTTPLP